MKMYSSLMVRAKVNSNCASGLMNRWRGEIYEETLSLAREHNRAVSLPKRECVFSKNFSWMGIFFLMVIVLDLVSLVVQAQGIYAVTRRVRIHPGLGVFLPPVTNVVVNTQPLPNSTGQGQMQGQGGFVGQPVVRPVYVRTDLPVDKEEVARKTLEFQQRRASEGSAFAQYDMGLRYLNGDGVASDKKEARRLLELSAKGGNTRAKHELEKHGWKLIGDTSSSKK